MGRFADTASGVAAFVAALLCAANAAAVGIRAPVPVAVRARLDLRVVADEATTPPGNLLSRSLADLSRFMTDLTAGDTRIGLLYLKGAATWSLADDALGRTAFVLEQGDYAFRRDGAGRLEARAFGDERRFFTGELGTPLLDDDVVERFQHRLGIRLDAARGAGRGTYLVSRLDEGDDARVTQFASAGAAATHASLSVSYLHDAPASGAEHAIAKSEAVACFRRLTAILSYEQSGFGDGAFLPSGSWGGGGGYAAAAPDNSATFAEVRARRLLTGDVGWIDASYRYAMVGAAYVDDLSLRRSGTVAHEAWVDWSHRKSALDVRLSFEDEVRFQLQNAHHTGTVLTTRAFLRDNSELLLRSGVRRDTFDGASTGSEGFVHGAYGRSLQRFSGYVHAMVERLGSDAVASAGAEGRINWNPRSALYARWIVVDAPDRPHSIYARLELRPTRRSWVTIGYGRAGVGEGPYFIEDSGWPPSPSSDDVLSITVRGDL